MGLAVLRQMHQVAPDNLVGAILFDDSDDPRSSLPDIISYCSLSGIKFGLAKGNKSAKEQLRALLPDIAIACGWYTLFDSEALALPKYGILGIHNSLLPEYRGGSPLVWALINGETKVGASLFRMTDGMDDGPVLARFPVEVGPTDTIGDVLPKLETEILRRMPSIWQQLILGVAAFEEQNHAMASYCALRTPEDGRIKWAQPARQVHNFIRAQSLPYPCAFAFNGNEEIRFVRTECVEEKWFGTPGQVITAGERPLISCGGDTALRVFEVLVGGNVAPASEVINSIKTRLC